jgi:hypothetical protein
MTKATKKRPGGKSSKAEPRPSRKKGQSARKGSYQARLRANTKQFCAISMLRSTKGASIAALMEATGWQQHSVRGFLAGVVRKRLGLDLQSSKVNGSRLYRITEPSGGQSGSTTAAES